MNIYCSQITAHWSKVSSTQKETLYEIPQKSIRKDVEKILVTSYTYYWIKGKHFCNVLKSKVGILDQLRIGCFWPIKGIQRKRKLIGKIPSLWAWSFLLSCSIPIPVTGCPPYSLLTFHSVVGWLGPIFTWSWWLNIKYWHFEALSSLQHDRMWQQYPIQCGSPCNNSSSNETPCRYTLSVCLEGCERIFDSPKIRYI